MAKHILMGKKEVLYLHEGPELRKLYDRIEKGRKSPAPGRIQTPQPQEISSTGNAVPQPLPKMQILNIFSWGKT